LTTFFETQERKRPKLPEEHFLNVVHGAASFDVLLITGLRDKALVAAFSHLVPGCRLIELHYQARRETRRDRGASDGIRLPAIRVVMIAVQPQTTWNTLHAFSSITTEL
jgi:hypothetical protein